MAELSTSAVPTRPTHSGRAEQGGDRSRRSGEAQQATAAGLDLLRVLGWLVLHDMALPGDPRRRVDHVLAGASGVYVVNTVSWSGAIETQNGSLRCGGTLHDDELAELSDAANGIRALLGGAPVAPLLCFERLEEVVGFAGDVGLCASENILDLLTGQPAILDSRAVAATATMLSSGLVSAPPAPAGGPPPVAKKRTRLSIRTPAAPATPPPPLTLPTSPAPPVVQPVAPPPVPGGEPTVDGTPPEAAPPDADRPDADRLEALQALERLVGGPLRTPEPAARIDEPRPEQVFLPVEEYVVDAVVETAAAPDVEVEAGSAPESTFDARKRQAWDALAREISEAEEREAAERAAAERAEQEAREAAEREAREAAEREAREAAERAEQEAREAAERAAAARAEQEAREAAERAAAERAEQEAREAAARAEQEAREAAERAALEAAERAAAARAEQEAREAAEREAREAAECAEQEAREAAERAAAERAEQEARAAEPEPAEGPEHSDVESAELAARAAAARAEEEAWEIAQQRAAERVAAARAAAQVPDASVVQAVSTASGPTVVDAPVQAVVVEAISRPKVRIPRLGLRGRAIDDDERTPIPHSALVMVLLGAVLVAGVIVGAPRMPDVVGWTSNVLASEPAPTTGTTVAVGADGFHPKVRVLAGKPVTAQGAKGSAAPKGEYLVAVPLSLENVGGTQWDVPVAAGTTVADSLGVTHTVDTAVKAVKGRPLLAAQVAVAPGKAATGWVVFSVPNGRTVTGVTVGLATSADDGGTGDSVTWQVAP